MKKLLFLLIIVIGAYYGYSALSERPLPKNTRIDRVLVHKSERKLEAYSNGKLVRSYTISLGKTPVGDKQHEGDHKTPEGRYTINGKNPHSAYYKNLCVSYPNAADRREAARLGKPVGGDIKIHGLPNKMPFIGRWHRLMDWTAGCMAVTNDEMEELYQAIPVGTPIEILP